VLLWNVATHQPIGNPLVPNDPVFSVAFSPDGKTLASGGAGSSVQLWDVVARRSIAALRTGQHHVNSVAFSPDGKSLASGSSDQTVRFWNVAAPPQNMANAADLARYLCALVGRSLTRAEWARWVPGLAYQNVCP